MTRKKKLFGLFLLLALPLLIILVKIQTENRTRAAAPDKLEAEGGVLAGNASLQTDTNASGGSYVKLQMNTSNPTPTPANQTGVGPRATPATPNGITVPSSIDKTGTTDVTAALQSWINSQSDGTAATPKVLIFPAGTIYRMNTGLRVDNKKYITFWGYGSTLRPMGNGSTSGNSALRLSDSDFIKILGFRIRGANDAAGTPSSYGVNGEYSMGIALYKDSDDIEIADNWISHVYGDGIYISYDPPNVPDRANMHHNLLELTGRQGIVPDAGIDHRIEWNIIRDIAMSAIDGEDARGGSVSLGPMYVRNNLFDRWMHFGTPAYYYTCHAFPIDYSAGDLSSMHDIYIENNTFQGGCVGPGNTFENVTWDADISMWGDQAKSNIFIRNNTFNLPANQRSGWAIRLNNVNGGEITGNVIPGQTVQCNNCTNVTKQ